MVQAHNIFSPLLRTAELICAAIVTGILARYENIVNSVDGPNNGRIIYSLVIACISLLVSILLIIPFRLAFYLFPLDFLLFIAWMVAFGLMTNLTSTDGCHSTWIWSNWGYYWGGYWRTVPISDADAVLVGTANCGQWRANLAFAFVGGIIWLCSAILGLYVVIEYPRDGREARTHSRLHKVTHFQRNGDQPQLEVTQTREGQAV